MRSIFTFKKRGLFMLSFVVALLAGGGSSAMAAYTITGPQILNSSDWEKQSGRWNEWSGGIYDYAGGNNLSDTELVSPMMTMTKGGQKVTVNGYNNGGSTSVFRVYYSQDKTNWELAKDLSSNMNATTGSAVDMTAEFEVEGNYYIKFVCNKVFIVTVTVDEYDVVYTPEMEVYSNSYGSIAQSGKTTDFGLVNEAPSYTYYVKNIDRGILTVEAEVTGGYTVSSSTLSLEAGQQQAITVTAPAKGASEGTLTITGKNGEEVIKTFTANFTGEVMDKEGKFFEDFNGTSLAKVTESDLSGWDKDVTAHDGAEGYYGTMQFYNDNGTTVLFYYVTSNYDKAAYLITPKLHVEGNSDKMYVRTNGLSDGVLTVSYSADKETWKKIGEYSISSYQVKSFSNIPEGDYYIKYELWNTTLDWVYGFNYASEATVLDETVAAEALTAGVQDVTLKYTAKAGWNTIALPFAVEDLSVFGTDAKAYAFNGYADGNISFTPATALEAGKPYVLYVGEVAEANGNFEFQQVNVEATEAAEVAFGGATFKATYAPVAKGEMTDKYGITPDGHVKKGSSNASMKGFRGYFELPAAGARIVIDGQEVTAIEGIETKANTVETIYNLNGQQLTKPQRGINIINGRKVVVK